MAVDLNNTRVSHSLSLGSSLWRLGNALSSEEFLQDIDYTTRVDVP